MSNFVNSQDGMFDDLIGTSTEDKIDQINESSETTAVVDDSLVEHLNDTDTEESENQEQTSDFIDTFLKEYGIENKVITYENDNGETEEVKFDELDESEKLAILRNLTSPNLSEDEIKVVNYLRANNCTIQDVIEAYKQQAVDEYIKNNGAPTKEYAIDDYTDDELYIADLKTKFKDMSDEEILADLEMAKANEELYNKKVQAIRNQYKAKEDEELEKIRIEDENRYKNFVSSITTSLQNFNEVSLDYKDAKSEKFGVDNSEKDQVYRYILQQDENGLTQFYKDMQDPNKLVRFAYLSLFGDDIISDVSTYWKQQLKSTRKNEQKAQTTIVKNKQKPEMREKIDVFKNRNTINLDVDFTDLL